MKFSKNIITMDQLTKAFRMVVKHLNWLYRDPLQQPINTSQGGVNSKRGTSSSPPCLFGSKLKITMALKTKTSSIRELKYRQGDDKNFLWICCYMHRLLYLNLKFSSSAQLSYFSDILHAFVEIMYYLLEPKGGGGGRILGLFYCLNLSDVYI